MSFARDTAASQRRRQQTRVEAPTLTRSRGKPGQQTQAENAVVGHATLPASTVGTKTSDSSTVVLSESASRGSSSRGYKLRVTHKDFEQTIMQRHGMVWDETAELRTASEHFGTPAAPSNAVQEEIAEWYQKELGSEDSTIWLPLDIESAVAVADEYSVMNEVGEEEAKVSFVAKIAFFRQDMAHRPHTRGKRRFTYCKMEWAPRPQDKRNGLYAPSVMGDHDVQSPGKEFAFDNKPDLTFWVSLCALESRYRCNVNGITFVVPRAEVSAPYLTVEFKKDGENREAAVNQLLASACLVLYNRVLLRQKREEKCGTAAQDSSCLRHYGVAFLASVAELYQFTPVFVEGHWSGCKTQRLTVCNVTVTEEVLRLRSWINEIQRWGLSEHTDAWAFDVKGVLVHWPGGRAAVSHTEEDLKAWGLRPDSAEGASRGG